MLGLRVLLPFYITTPGALLAAAGDVDGARERYEESLALAAETGMRFYDAETMRRIAQLAPDRDAGRLGAARRTRTRPHRKQRGRSSCASRSTCTSLLGEDARSLLEQAMQAFGEGAMTAELEAARARLMVSR